MSRQVRVNILQCLKMKLIKALTIKGNVGLPGDKSISHRAVLFGSLANGMTEISNFAASADCASTMACMQKLGVSIRRDGANVTIDGVGVRGFSKPDSELDCGNSGTTMRLLSGILAGQPFESVMIGDESLSGRPMQRVIDPLNEMGATITSVEGHAPLTINGTADIKPLTYAPPKASAQLKSCVLLAGLTADGTTTVIEKTPTRDHTERMLELFKADINIKEIDGAKHISVNGGKELTPAKIVVPGDISASAFFIVAAAALPGSEIVMPNVGLNPTRSAIIDVMKDLGADISVFDSGQKTGEPIGEIVVKGGIDRADTGKPFLINGAIIANLIDELPVIAVCGTQVPGGIEIRDAAELRVKESDRISAVVENLRLMGADVEEFEDGMLVKQSTLTGAKVESFGDHRIAMAFGIASLFAEGETEIVEPECVDVSFPGFFNVLDSVAVR